jgi:pantetheine-phosphate adenylyltransferase
MRKAIYPGSFDPITFGHIDIVNRACKIFDEITIIIAHNTVKNTMFTVDERVTLTKEVFKDNPKVNVATYKGLTVDCASDLGAVSIIRGLRMVTDFEFEFQMNLANKVLNDDIETVFFMTKVENSYISSSIVKEIHQLDGDIEKFVPQVIIDALNAKKD